MKKSSLLLLLFSCMMIASCVKYDDGGIPADGIPPPDGSPTQPPTGGSPAPPTGGSGVPSAFCQGCADYVHAIRDGNMYPNPGDALTTYSTYHFYISSSRPYNVGVVFSAWQTTGGVSSQVIMSGVGLPAFIPAGQVNSTELTTFNDLNQLCSGVSVSVNYGSMFVQKDYSLKIEHVYQVDNFGTELADITNTYSLGNSPITVSITGTCGPNNNGAPPAPAPPPH